MNASHAAPAPDTGARGGAGRRRDRHRRLSTQRDRPNPDRKQPPPITVGLNWSFRQLWTVIGTRVRASRDPARDHRTHVRSRGSAPRGPAVGTALRTRPAGGRACASPRRRRSRSVRTAPAGRPWPKRSPRASGWTAGAVRGTGGTEPLGHIGELAQEGGQVMAPPTPRADRAPGRRHRGGRRARPQQLGRARARRPPAPLPHRPADLSAPRPRLRTSPESPAPSHKGEPLSRRRVGQGPWRLLLPRIPRRMHGNPAGRRSASVRTDGRRTDAAYRAISYAPESASTRSQTRAERASSTTGRRTAPSAQLCCASVAESLPWSSTA